MSAQFAYLCHGVQYRVKDRRNQGMDLRTQRYELIIRGGMLVTAKGFKHCSVGVLNGKVESIEEEMKEGEAKEVIDASGMYVLPGFVDAHTHPYYEDDFSTLPQVAAYGGTTTVIHYAYAFPGESVRQALDKAFENAGSSCIDYAFHLGLFEVEKQYTDIPRAFPYGIKSFKMFMTYAKLGRMTNDYYLAAAMDLVAEQGGMVMVHAENGLATDYLEDKYQKAKTPPLDSFQKVRPAILEEEAINRAISIARVCSCPIYIPHISIGRGMDPIRRAREAGHTVYAETCPQYLLLTEDDFYKWGPLAKIGPPLRKKEDNLALWESVKRGEMDVIASDHAPKTKKLGDDFISAGYGSPQAETLFYTVYQAGCNSGFISLPQLVRCLAENPARIFGLYPKKGTLEVGSDADFILFDPGRRHVLRGATQHTKAGYTLYEGLEVQGEVRAVYQRGRPVVRNGVLVAETGSGEYVPQGTHPASYRAFGEQRSHA